MCRLGRTENDFPPAPEHACPAPKRLGTAPKPPGRTPDGILGRCEPPKSLTCAILQRIRPTTAAWAPSERPTRRRIAAPMPQSVGSPIANAQASRLPGGAGACFRFPHESHPPLAASTDRSNAGARSPLGWGEACPVRAELRAPLAGTMQLEWGARASRLRFSASGQKPLAARQQNRLG